MLVIEVELWPAGDERFKRVLARAGIGNISDLADVSDYEVVASESANPISGTPAWKERGHLHQHDRRHSVWAFVAKAATWAATRRRSSPEIKTQRAAHGPKRRDASSESRR